MVRYARQKLFLRQSVSFILKGSVRRGYLPFEWGNLCPIGVAPRVFLKTRPLAKKVFIFARAFYFYLEKERKIIWQ